jgi:chitinase
VRVFYSTANVTANGGTGCATDYDTVSNQQLVFEPGETTRVVRIFVFDCTENDAFVSFRLNLLSDDQHLPVNATIGRASGLVNIVNNPPSAASVPRLFVRDVTVDEKDGYAVVPVLLGGPAGQFSSSQITVAYATADGTARQPEEYLQVNGTLTFAPGQNVKNVYVPIVDAGAKSVNSFTLNLSNATNATIIDGKGTVTIGAPPSDSFPVAVPSVSAPPDVVVGEGDGYVDLPVRLSAPGTGPVSITYDSGFIGTGTSCGSDPDSAPDILRTDGTLRFAPGETTKVVRVQLLNCPQVEKFESFRFTLITPGSVNIARSNALVGIVDASNVVATPSLVVRDAIVDREDGSAIVPVMLGGPSGQTYNSDVPVTVHYASANVTATDGVDYRAVSGDLTFAPGQTVKNIVVPILDPSGSKPTRTFVINMTNPSANSSLADAKATVTIGASEAIAVGGPRISAPADVIVGEADGYVDLPVRLSAPGINPISVTYTTASAGADSGNSCTGTDPPDFVGVTSALPLNFAPGETTKVVRIPLVDCPEVEQLSSFRFNLSTSPTPPATTARASTFVSIVNASNVVSPAHLFARDAVADQKDGYVIVPVLLGGPAGQSSAGTVKVDYATSDGTAVEGVDYGNVGGPKITGTLVFAPGQTVKNVVIPILDPGLTSTQRTFALNLSNVQNGSVDDATAIVTIGATPAEVATPTLFAPPDVVVNESDGYVDLIVRMSAPSATPVTVSYGTAANSGASSGTPPCGTGANPPDFVSASGTMTFGPGETTKFVRVQLIDCPEVEGLISFRFTLSNPANATIDAARGPTTTVTIANNDTAFTPNNTGLPTISGTTEPGFTLTASPGTWTGLPSGYQYVWQRCDSNGAACGSIGGATLSTYQLGAADVGQRLRVEVTATNSLGTSVPAYSVPTALIVSLPSAPLNVTAAAGDRFANVYFSPPVSGGGGFTYTVTVSPGGATVMGSASPIKVTNLTNGVTYTFTVTATNALGTGPASAPSNPVTPARRAPLPPDPPAPSPRPDVPAPPPPGPRPPRP